MPLSLSPAGSEVCIKAIKGRTRRRFWRAWGLLWAERACDLSELNGDLIVNIKESRVAISRGMANRIMV